MFLAVLEFLLLLLALMGWLFGGGGVRATKDIDLLADISLNEIFDVCRQLEKFGFICDYRKGDVSDPVKGVLELRYKDSGNEEIIDIVLGIEKLPDDVYKRAVKIDFLGMEYPVVSPEDLIIAKFIAGSPVDFGRY